MGLEPTYDDVEFRGAAYSHLGGDLMVRKVEGDSIADGFWVTDDEGEDVLTHLESENYIIPDGFWVTDEENEEVLAHFDLGSYGKAIGFVEGVDTERGNYDRPVPPKRRR